MAGTAIVTLLYFIAKLIPAIAFLSEPADVKMFQGGGALLAAVGIPFWIWTSSRSALGKQRKLIEKDLQENSAEVLCVTTNQAIRRELNGEEQLFFIKVENSKVLFLCGEYLIKPMLAGKFPSTEFELVRGLHSRMIFKLSCLGEPFAAKRCCLSSTPTTAVFPSTAMSSTPNLAPSKPIYPASINIKTYTLSL